MYPQKSHDQIRNSKRALWLALAVAGAALQVKAQVGSAVNQVANSNTREQLNQAAESKLTATNSVPQLYEGETSDVGPQSVVTPSVRHTLFQASADVQLFYTDNALLTGSHKIDTGVLLSKAQFALAPTPYPLGNGTLAPRVGYEGQWFDYLFNDQQVVFIGNKFTFPPRPELSDFDFNSQTVFGDATWTHDHLSFGGGLEATRMFTTAHYDPFYDELVPYWSARYVWQLCEKSALSATYFGDYRWTSVTPNPGFGVVDSNINDRTDQGLLLTWTQMLNKHVVFQPFYEFKYTRFTKPVVTAMNVINTVETTRNDYLNTVGAGIYWLVCPNCTVRGFVNYNNLMSNISRFEYREFDGGGGLDVTIRF
jgi:hypothetical protein